MEHLTPRDQGIGQKNHAVASSRPLHRFGRQPQRIIDFTAPRQQLRARLARADREMRLMRSRELGGDLKAGVPAAMTRTAPALALLGTAPPVSETLARSGSRSAPCGSDPRDGLTIWTNP